MRSIKTELGINTYIKTYHNQTQNEITNFLKEKKVDTRCLVLIASPGSYKLSLLANVLTCCTY